jgi:hypothetical protein
VSKLLKYLIARFFVMNGAAAKETGTAQEIARCGSRVHRRFGDTATSSARLGVKHLLSKHPPCALARQESAIADRCAEKMLRRYPSIRKSISNRRIFDGGSENGGATVRTGSFLVVF